MTVITTSPIVLDDRGVAFIEGTQTRVTQVAQDMIGGLEAAQIHASYPNLSLAQIHSALAYYYDHHTDMDAQISHAQAEVEERRQEAIRGGNQPTRAILEGRLRGAGNFG